MLASVARNLSVRDNASVAANSAFVPTPVWKMASFAGRLSSERTRAPIACGSRSGSSASAGAWKGTPPRPATSPASCSPMRLSRIATCFGCMALLACDAGVGEREAIAHVAHQGAREVQLCADAHLLERLRLEFGDDDVGHRLHGGMARLFAAA